MRYEINLRQMLRQYRKNKLTILIDILIFGILSKIEFL